MFSELPKLFDRSFVIAYFLPVTIFTALSAWFSGYWSKIKGILAGNAAFDIALLAFDATLVILAAWIAAIILMVLNREIYRLVEGYWKYNPLRLFESRIKRRFRKKQERLSWLDEQYSKRSFTDELRKERERIMKELAENYPDQESLILPTTFGNTLRAFEVYPRVMYGLEGIDGWARILAVIPKEYRDLIDDAKSQVDWWVNMGVMSLLFIIEFWIIVFSRWGLAPGLLITTLNIIVPLGILVAVNWFFLWRATSAAVGWGDYVKSAFDIYRFDLLESLHIEAPVSREEEKELWTKYSQAMIYRLPGRLPELEKAANETAAGKGNAKGKQ